MDIIVSGIITQILPLEQGVSQKTGTPWARQSVVIEHESGQYPRSIVVDINGQDRINGMALAVGQQVTAHLNVNCREYNGRFFNSIDCWKVERPNQAPQPQAQPAQQAQQPYAQQPQAQPGNGVYYQNPPAQPAQPAQAPQGGNGDLPF